VSGFFCTGCSVVVSELEEIFRSSLLLHTHLSWHVDGGMLCDNTLSTNGSPPYLSHHHGRRRGTLLSISSSSCLCFWNARLNFLSSSKPSEFSPSVEKNLQEELWSVNSVYTPLPLRLTPATAAACSNHEEEENKIDE
jgi:hypothetical protein